MTIPTRAEVNVLIRERIAADPEFRQRLMADPHAALSDLVGITIPEVVSIEVHEESLTSVHLVLPAGPAMAELSDDDLELVAGGACWANGVSSEREALGP